MMLSFLTTRLLGDAPADHPLDLPVDLSESFPEDAIDLLADSFPEIEESTLLKTMGWISAGLGAVALGLFVGRELRQRYKFNRRTPYDFYSHSGDEHDLEFGVGV